MIDPKPRFRVLKDKDVLERLDAEKHQDERFEPIPPDPYDAAAYDAGVPRWGEI